MNENCIDFVAVGDFGLGNNESTKIGRLISMLETDGVEFTLGLGDNFYPRGLDSDILEEQIQTIWTIPFGEKCKHPFYMVLGNHDYLGDIHLQIGDSKIDPKWILPNRYYDIIMNRNGIILHLLMIDTNFNQQTSLEKKQQFDWIENKLKKNKGKVDWTILVGHHPWLSNGFHGNSKGELRSFYNHLIKHYTIDFIINGHDHDKQLILGSNNTKQIVCGTGSTIRAFNKRNQSNRHLVSLETIGVCRVRLYKRRALIYFLDSDGNIETSQLFVSKHFTRKFNKKA